LILALEKNSQGTSGRENETARSATRDDGSSV
jgi:hypothetical protein